MKAKWLKDSKMSAKQFNRSLLGASQMAGTQLNDWDSAKWLVIMFFSSSSKETQIPQKNDLKIHAFSQLLWPEKNVFPATFHFEQPCQNSFCVEASALVPGHKSSCQFQNVIHISGPHQKHSRLGLFQAYWFWGITLRLIHTYIKGRATFCWFT